LHNKQSVRSELRHEMRRVLSSLDPRWIRAASREVCAQLGQIIDEHNPDHLLAWVAHFPGEIDLSLVIDDQLDRRKVCLPRTGPTGLSFFQINHNWRNTLEIGWGGIPEPRANTVEYNAAHEQSTIVLVPGLAFDMEGDRLGRGKGYYDRYLGSSNMINVQRVGVSWALQIVDRVPAASHDVKMDWVCHERAAVRVGFPQ